MKRYVVLEASSLADLEGLVNARMSRCEVTLVGGVSTTTSREDYYVAIEIKSTRVITKFYQAILWEE